MLLLLLFSNPEHEINFRDLFKKIFYLLNKKKRIIYDKYRFEIKAYSKDNVNNLSQKSLDFIFKG